MVIRRILAAIIDFGPFGVGLAMACYNLRNQRAFLSFVFPILAWAIWFIYLTWITLYVYKNNGQTIGYSVMGLRLKSADGDPLTLKRVFIRTSLFAFCCGPAWIYYPFASLIIFIPLACYAFSKQGKQLRQAGWDLATRTVVVLVN